MQYIYIIDKVTACSICLKVIGPREKSVQYQFIAKSIPKEIHGATKILN